MLLLLTAALASAADLTLVFHAADGVAEGTWTGPINAWPEQKVANYTVRVWPVSFDEAAQSYAMKVEVCRAWTRKKVTGDNCWEQSFTATTTESEHASFTMEGDDKQEWGFDFRAKWSGAAEPVQAAAAKPANGLEVPPPTDVNTPGAVAEEPPPL